MFSGIFACAYLVVGLITAGVTITVFPPLEGFRPKPGTFFLALATFTLLWPVLVGLALWYGLTSCIQKCESGSGKKDEEEQTDVSRRLSVKPR